MCLQCYVTYDDESDARYGNKIKNQKIWKDELLKKLNGRKAPEGFEDLVLVTTRNAPVGRNDTNYSNGVKVV